MTSQVDIELTAVSFTDLEQRIRLSKSAKSVRNYIAVINRLKGFTGRDCIALWELNPSFVARFADYLLHDGVAQSSINHFKMILRAMFKDEFGKEHAKEFKEAFKGISSTNTAETRTADLDDARRLIGSKLNGNQFLQKIKEVFLFGLFGGGMSYMALKRTRPDSPDLNQHQQMIVDRFKSQYNGDFFQFVNAMSEENYTNGLRAIGHAAGIQHHLRPTSGSDIWIEAGIKAGLETAMIEGSLADAVDAALSPYELMRTRDVIANQLLDIKQRWYVMRCHGTKPDEMKTRINESKAVGLNEPIDTFIAPQPTAKIKAATPTSIINSMLFFRCSQSTAINIRNAVKGTAWVYTHAGTTTPAYIPAYEMKTFMLLCDISDGTLSYHFPHTNQVEPQIETGQKARITNGAFEGYVGIVRTLPNKKYKVALTLTTLCATITAEVPLDFLELA